MFPLLFALRTPNQIGEELQWRKGSSGGVQTQMCCRFGHAIPSARKWLFHCFWRLTASGATRTGPLVRGSCSEARNGDTAATRRAHWNINTAAGLQFICTWLCRHQRVAQIVLVFICNRQLGGEKKKNLTWKWKQRLSNPQYRGDWWLWLIKSKRGKAVSDTPGHVAP